MALTGWVPLLIPLFPQAFYEHYSGILKCCNVCHNCIYPSVLILPHLCSGLVRCLSEQRP